jgi:2-methylisocitrate lyase-like PEP mutase family enzyme
MNARQTKELLRRKLLVAQAVRWSMARLAEEAGFEAAYLSGGAVA